MISDSEKICIICPARDGRGPANISVVDEVAFGAGLSTVVQSKLLPWRNSRTVYRCFNINQVFVPSVMFQALFGAAKPKNCQSHERFYSHPTFETNAFGYESFQIGESLLCYFDMIFNRSPCA